MDLYDCIIVFLEVPRTSHMTTEKSQLLAIPAVRPLGVASRDLLPTGDTDVESTGRDMLNEEMRFSSPKGSKNHGMHEVEWCYLIPCEGGRWIHASSTLLKALQTTHGRVMTGRDVTAKLHSGDWNISLEKVEMVCDVLSMSRSVTEMVVNLFGTNLGVTVDH